MTPRDIMAPSATPLGTHSKIVKESTVGSIISGMFKFKFIKRHNTTQYLRVRRCVLEGVQVCVVDEEPIGVTIARNPAVPTTDISGKVTNDVYWTKVGSQWISSDQREDIFLRAEPITKTEFETDLAFGLWPKLKTTNRPFRAWSRLNRYLLKKWSTVIATLSLGGVSWTMSQADGAINNWFILGICLAGVATVACVTFLVTNDFEW